MTSYSTIQPPFTLKFPEMSKKELKDYFRWFMAEIPERIAVLANAVRQTPGYENWQPDYSPKSLDLLGQWFASQVETRQRTLGEIKADEDPRFPGVVSERQLTIRTFSLAMDVGMYLSQVFLKNNPSLRWDQPFGSKRFIDYGQPVLVEFDAAPFNPVWMMVTQAWGISSQAWSGRKLEELYHKWAKKIRS